MTEPIIAGQTSLIDSNSSPFLSSVEPEKLSDNPKQAAFSSEPQIAVGETIIDCGAALSLDDFQVVRREFYAHIREPAITFNNYCFSVNNACIARFPHADFVQILVDSRKKLLALRPCGEGTRDSYQWCMYSKGKRMPRRIAGKIFIAMVINLMGWNPHDRYRVLGWLIRANDEHLLLFDLTAKETYQRIFEEGVPPQMSRTAIYSEDWQNSFGLPYSEHKCKVQVNIFDGFAVYMVPVLPQRKASNSNAETGSPSQNGTSGDTGV